MTNPSARRRRPGTGRGSAEFPGLRRRRRASTRGRPLVVVDRLGDADVGVHVDHRHHPARDVGPVRRGVVERPAEVVADLAERERLSDVREVLLGQGLLRAPRSDSSLIARSRPYAKRWLPAANASGPISIGRLLQRDPDRHAAVGRQRPVVLVGVPRRDAAAGLLVERLVVVQPDAVDAEQLAPRSAASRREKTKLPDRLAVLATGS